MTEEKEEARKENKQNSSKLTEDRRKSVVQ